MANIPTANNNPGDIRSPNGDFNIGASTPLDGQAALYNDLTAKMTGKSKTGLNGNSTLYEFAQKYDPKGDGSNDPISYTAKLANQLGVSPDTKIGTLLPRIDDFAKAVANNEGYKGAWAGGSSNDTYNPTPYSKPNPGQFDFSGVSTQPTTPAPSVGNKIGTGITQGLGQAGQAGLGALKSIANTANTVSGWGQGLMSKLIPGGVATASLPKNVTNATNPDQQAGYLGGQIGQFFAPGEAEEAVGKAASTLPKLAELGIKGGASGLMNTLLAKAQGQGNTGAGIVGGISTVAPFAGELLGKVPAVLRDFFGGDGTADALKVKQATPNLVKAWQNGDRTVNDLADTITQTAKNYNTQGIQKLQAVKDALPDIGIPATNTQGGIQKIIDSASGNNLTVEEERTLQKLQNFVKENVANDSSIKGNLNLKTGIDDGNFYHYGDPSYKNSNSVVSKVRNFLTDTSVNRAANYDAQYGTNLAPTIKNALADATDRINFMDKFKANLIGKNPETYVEQTVNKLNPLINKFGDEGSKVATKNLLSEFEQRIEQPGIFSKDFQAANAAKNLTGLGGRYAKSALKYVAPELSVGLAGGLIGHALTKKSSPQQ